MGQLRKLFPRREPGDGTEAGALPMVHSSIGLMVGRAASMGLGFLFWLLAARIVSPAQVGLTAGATSAIMLCGQLALPGVGSALISRYPTHRHSPGKLLNTAFTIAVAAGLVVGVLFLLLARGLFSELSVVAANPLFFVMFLGMSVLGTLGYIFDLVSMAKGRGDHVVVRNMANGVLTILPLALVPLLGFHPTSQQLFGFWVLGALAAVAIGFVQFSRGRDSYRFQLRIDRVVAPGLIREGLSNQALTLGENAPGLIMAVMVTELLSPTANAYWYTVWMMAWAVYVIPISLGVALFAEAVQRPEGLRDMVLKARRSSLTLGLPAALVVAALAHPLLSLLGPDYAAAGTTPLRILVLGVLPLTFTQMYFAVSRASGALKRAVTTSLAALVCGLAAAAAGGLLTGNLVGMAAGWVSVQCLLGGVCAWRTHRLLDHAGATFAASRAAPHLELVPPVVPEALAS